jgi:ParB-like chromosome segregation protein Spo0J|nr:MAG TPA: hypothetical protein [Bacteriophage sp.]
MKVINDNKLPTAPISEFKETQGDLKFLSKDNYSKLKRNIERRGFYLPVYVWVDKSGQKWLLDGHQRKHVLTTEGWNDPIPYLVVPAKNKEEAAQRLLEITSQFGTITQEGIDEFIAKFELPEIETLENVNFDGIFTFSIEAEPKEEEFDDEQIEQKENTDPAIKFEVRLIDGAYRAKYTENKKAHEIGSFESIVEVQEAISNILEDWSEQ